MSDVRQNPIAAFLAVHDPMILDGALATELQRRGANLDDSLWSAKILIEQPGLIRDVHLDYFKAGADVATTASYQATFEGFGQRGIGAPAAAALMRQSVALAVSARDEFWAKVKNRARRARPLIAASVGPYGAMRADGSEYRGRYGLSETELMAFHRPRMAVLANAGADLLACETIPCLSEAIALARLLREFPGVCAWISFSCQDGAHNNEGQSLADCIHRLHEYDQVSAVGVNCTPPGFITSLIENARSSTHKPIIVYPNSGERYDPATKQWDSCAGPPDFTKAAREWRGAGARLIGGCCRTTPDDIAALRSALSAE